MVAFAALMRRPVREDAIQIERKQGFTESHDSVKIKVFLNTGSHISKPGQGENKGFQKRKGSQHPLLEFLYVLYF